MLILYGHSVARCPTYSPNIHSPTIPATLHSMGLGKHRPGECTGRKQSRIGILIRLIQLSRIQIVFISPGGATSNPVCPDVCVQR